MAGLFRKKPGRDGSSARRGPRGFEEEYEEEEEEACEKTGPTGADRTIDVEDEDHSGEPDSTWPVSADELRELMGRLKGIDDKLGRVDSALARNRSENVKVRDRLNQMEQDMRKLLSVREGASPKFDPFTEVPEKDTRRQLPPPVTADKGAQFGPIDWDGDLPEFVPYREGEMEPPSFRVEEPMTERDTVPFEPETSTADAEPVMAGPGGGVQPTLHETSKDERHERQVRAAARSKHNKKPLLAYIPHDYLALVLVMRWIEFLFERVTRDKISLVLDYYVDVGWISEDVKSEIMSYARGEMQDVTKYMGQEEVGEEVFRDLPPPAAAPYKKVEDWRLSADDHLKSLLFVQKVAGIEVDRDRLNSLEQNISKFKESLEGFHGV